jgi:hypothetical protein
MKEALDKIKEADPDFYSSLEEVIIYLSNTYDDKYQNSEIRTDKIIYSSHLGKGFNMGNAAKYISRYVTAGFQKSEMPADLMKAIHYCLFELTRKVNKRNDL